MEYNTILKQNPKLRIFLYSKGWHPSYSEMIVMRIRKDLRHINDSFYWEDQMIEKLDDPKYHYQIARAD